MAKKALVLLMVLSILVVAGCSGPQQGAAKKYTIAVTGALTGPSAQDGTDIKNGATLAAEYINSKGGVKGVPIELVYEDDRSDPKEAANVANKLVKDTKVLAVIGHYNSSCTLAGAPIYNKAGLLEVSCGSTSPAVSEAGPYTFRVIVTDAFQGAFVANWMVEGEGLKKVAIMYENDDYGSGLKDVITKEVAKNGGEIVGVESFYLGETKDFTPLITKIRGLKPDALFIAGLYNETALIAKQSAEVGWKPPIFAVDGPYSAAYIDLGGEAVEGTRLVGFFHTGLQDPIVQKFVADYKAKYSVEPGTYAANGYDALLILAEAIEKKGPDRKAMMEYLTTLKGFRGVSGTISFDEKGDCVKDPIKIVVKDGKFQVYDKK